jgi:hypothetical protein
MINKIGVIAALVFTTLFVYSCKNKPTQTDDTSPKPGKRDYTWTIDTLAYPGSMQTLMRDIWASSPTNVYVVGHNDQNMGHMFHYDGIKWSAVKLTWSDGGPLTGAIDLSSIYGFGPNDIYAVGERIYDNPNPPYGFLDSSLIIHYDGVKWEDIKLKKGRMLLSIHGTTPNNIWSGGICGTLYKYNGYNWSKLEYPDSFSINSIISVSLNEIYLLAYLDTQPINSYSVFDYSNSLKWFRLDSTERGWINSQFGIANLFYDSNKRLYSVGYGIFERTGNSWKKIVNSDLSIRRISGNSANNLFAVGQSGIYHYNGTDWYKYTQFFDTSIIWSGVWTDGSEVFIVGNNGQKTFILHGK